MRRHRDIGHRLAYAADASIFEITPQEVIVPESIEELRALVDQVEGPIVARGAGTSITGGCLTEGTVIDCSQLNKILEININEEYVRVEPGVVQNRLNEALEPFGYRLGPDTSTGNRATIGGMIANNAAGAFALRYGRTSDALLDVELIGSSVIQEQIDSLWQRHKATIEEFFPKPRRRASGYNLDSLPSLPKLIAGSEGTLGLIGEAKLRIVPKEKTYLSLYTYPSMDEAIAAIPGLLEREPHALEMVDHHMIELGRISPSMRGRLGFLRGHPQAILLAAFPTPQENVLSQRDAEAAWALRKAGVGLLLSRRTYSRAIAFIEDVAVPVESLGTFIPQLRAIIGREAGIYGHAGDGCLHVRPFIDLRSEQREMVRILEETAELVCSFGGTLSGEHGDGLIRSYLNPVIFGEEIMEIFKEIKTLFDPQNRFSPGLIVDGQLSLNNIRQTHAREPKTEFQFRDGFAFAADMCNGNGACRKKEGLMCPSFHAYDDEYHTTRARAQALRHLPLDDPALYDVLQYCLSCKGCKTECPSEVDMAKLKSEFLFHYHKKHRRPLIDHAIKQIDKVAHLIPRRYAPKGGKRPIVLFQDTWNARFSSRRCKAALHWLQSQEYRVIVPPYRCCGRPLISKGFLPEAKKRAKALIETYLPYAEQGIPILILEPSCFSAITDDYPDLIDAQTIAESCILLDEIAPPLPSNTYIHTHCHQKTLHPNYLDGCHLESTCCGMAGSFGHEHKKMSLEIGEAKLFPQIRALPDDAIIVANGYSCRQQIKRGTGREALHLIDLCNSAP